MASAAAVAVAAAPGEISTFAGTGASGYSGDGGPAARARLNGPRTVAIASDGSILIAEASNHVVRRVDRTGTISTIAGDGTKGDRGDGGPARGARLNRPKGLATDPAGSVYIADTGNNRVRRIDPSGIITTIAGTGEAGFGETGVKRPAQSSTTPGAWLWMLRATSTSATG